ncbi:MAG TPA: DMT family transporter [Nocardioidaceae bacterium]|nr:DMT family transporter [Nocardioidaceae bacterium]
MVLVAIIAALAAGVCFAVGGYLQQREASTRPQEESLSPRLLVDLARRPAWLAGIGSTAGSFLFKAVALTFGPLSIVQPLIASELIFAIPPSVHRHGFRLHLREWLGIGMVTVGLALGIYSADPQQGDPLPPLLRWVELLGTLAVVAAVSLLVAKRVRGPARASVYALAAVAVLVSQSALLAATVALFKMGVVTALTSWQPYAMGVVSFVALTLVQSSYQAGPLAASMPIMDAANPVLAIAVGIGVLDETVSTGTWNIVGAVTGVVLLVAGVLVVDTSPVVRRVQRVEKREQEEREQEERAQEERAQEEGEGDPDPAR